MFCPQCGHAQPIDEVMYCSSCGFTLRGVQHLLLTGGETSGEAGRSPVRDFLNRRGIKLGLVMWMIGTVLVPMLAASDAPKGVVGITALIFFVGGFMRMLYAWLFQYEQQQQRRRASIQATQAQALPAAPTKLRALSQKLKFRGKPSALPAATPAAIRLDVTGRRTTGQLVQPPSVTDHTTRLLDNNGSR